MSGRTVFMVTSGSYSDYGVDDIFERREDAEAYVAAKMGEEIEEVTLYSELPQLYTLYRAEISKQPTYGGPAGQLRMWDWRTLGEPRHVADESQFSFSSQGPDRERCVKSVSDRYAAWKARQAGVA